MRVYFRSTELPLRFARAIKQVFPFLKLSTSQEWAGQMFGYRNWHELAEHAKVYQGEPSDVWREGLRENDIRLPSGEYVSMLDSYDKYQNAVLQRLIGPMVSDLESTGAREDIYFYARHGTSKTPRMNLGKGQPFYEAIQFPWFELEDHATADVATGEGMELGGLDLSGYAIREGFSDAAHANRWFAGSTNASEEFVRAIRDAATGRALEREIPVHAGGSAISASIDDEGHSQAAQQSKYRYWYRSPTGEMVGGFRLTITLRAQADTAARDALEIALHQAWTLNTWPSRFALDGIFLSGVIHQHLISAVRSFLLTRVGQLEPSGQLRVFHDARRQSVYLAHQLHDLLWDSLLDEHGFSPEVFRYVDREIHELPRAPVDYSGWKSGT